MITSKQRAYLRGLANTMQPIFQIGKGGIEEAFLKQIEDALEKRELIKIKVLENSGCEGIQAIGSKIVLFKQSKKKPTIELPVARKK